MRKLQPKEHPQQSTRNPQLRHRRGASAARGQRGERWGGKLPAHLHGDVPGGRLARRQDVHPRFYLSERNPKATFSAVVIGAGELARYDKDADIYVIPLTSLGPNAAHLRCLRASSSGLGHFLLRKRKTRRNRLRGRGQADRKRLAYGSQIGVATKTLCFHNYELLILSIIYFR